MILKNLLATLALLLMVTRLNAYSSFDKVIYGSDNRQDLKDVINSSHLEWARSTAAMIDKKYLIAKTENFFEIKYGTLLEKKKVCPEARFAEQIIAADCTGFLVADDILVTAGHCVKKLKDCQNIRWVFDYSIIDQNSDSKNVLAENVYRCREIIAHVENDETQNDFTILRLDRSVSGRVPLRFRSEGRVNVGTPLVLIGHPSGLPTKVADGAYVLKNSNDIYFVSNVDSFGGNSGSPVMNSESGEVEGILVRGDDDYVMDKERKCRMPKVCKMDGCRGEDATRITNLSDIINKNLKLRN
jgi:V8-like Glu-specific endopeptidase